MKKVLLVLTATFFLTAGVFAAGNDSSERGVTTVPLKIFSGGFGLGSMMPVSEDFRDCCGDVFFSAALVGSWQFRERVALFADASWFIADAAANGGVEAGIDYLFSTSSFRPFVGAGVGMFYFFREGDDLKFNDKAGPVATAHIGCAFDITETVQMRFRAPYRFIKTKTNDHGFGLDVGVMFSSQFSKVRKLNY